MRIKAYQKFRHLYRKLPSNIQKKTDKQLAILAENMTHPSLHTKKIKGKEGIWEVRVDIHFRLTFEIIEDTIFLRVVGSHDEVLRKP